jgi:peptide/nickel transport system substrate-binding protein
MNGPTKRPANFGKVVMRTIPDQGSQISSLMVGDVDMFRGLPADQAENLARDPRFALSINPNLGTTFMWFDTIGRGGNKALLNPKVREALTLAVNRKNLEKVVNGNLHLVIPDNLCWKDRILGCAYNKTAPQYDPKKAKQMLADAGYPNGFSVRITSYVGRLTLLAEAVAGDLAAIGVKATVEPLTVSTFSKKAQAGQIQMTVAGNSLGGLPDISELFNYFFLVYDMTADQEILALGKQMDNERDPDKRKLISAKIFDRVAEQSFITPLTSQPHLFIHTKELELDTRSSNSYGIDISRIKWKGQK